MAKVETEINHTYKSINSGTFSSRSTTTFKDGTTAVELGLNNYGIPTNGPGFATTHFAQVPQVPIVPNPSQIPKNEDSIEEASNEEGQERGNDIDVLVIDSGREFLRKPIFKGLLLAVFIAIVAVGCIAAGFHIAAKKTNDAKERVPPDFQMAKSIIFNESLTNSFTSTTDTSSTFPPKLVYGVSSTILEISFLSDICLISNKTKEVLIKSTKSLDTSTIFKFDDCPLPQGHRFVTVENTGEDLFYLIEVLEWLGPSITKLTFDGGIASGKCRNQKRPPVSKYERIRFPILEELYIHNLNRCFITNWFRSFRLPKIEIVKISLDDNDPYDYYHRDLAGILNLSKPDYSLEIE